MQDNGAMSDNERILEGPSIWETVINAFLAINSHPILLLIWLVASSAIVLFNRMALPLELKVPMYAGSGLLALFLPSGVMGSMELIIRREGWMIAAIWECAKLYFSRFILLALVLVAVFLVIYIPLSAIVEFLGPPYFPEKDLIYPLFAAATIVGLLLLAFFMTFAGSSIIVENLLPLEAIERSFWILMANRRKELILWFAFVGTAAAVELTFDMVLQPDWKGKVLQNAILSYIFLLMLMSVMYFNYAVKLRSECEE